MALTMRCLAMYDSWKVLLSCNTHPMPDSFVYIRKKSRTKSSLHIWQQHIIDYDFCYSWRWFTSCMCVEVLSDFSGFRGMSQYRYSCQLNSEYNGSIKRQASKKWLRLYWVKFHSLISASTKTPVKKTKRRSTIGIRHAVSRLVKSTQERLHEHKSGLRRWVTTLHYMFIDHNTETTLRRAQETNILTKRTKMNIKKALIGYMQKQRKRKKWTWNSMPACWNR